MNGRRRFLVGTVLSIQDGNFIYPACQNCCSRLTHTSCRYECHKCGATSKDAVHRYKLCLKVSEERRLRVITIFGRCLEQVFGGSADVLHSQLQVSCQLSGDLEHERAQELLLRAAEHCLIGRSFIFAVKIPQNFDQSDSPSHLHRNLVACQIILFNEDPMSCTVLGYFNQLVASASSNNPIHARTDVSADTTNRDLSDLEFPESSSGRPQRWNHYAEYWQQSLGLVSSPLSNTLAENSKYRQGESKGTERDVTSRNATVTSRNATVSTRRKRNASDTALMTSISTPGVKCSSSGHVHTNTHSPPSSSHFRSFSSKSKMLLGPESYLQNVLKSGSRRSQSCSASSAHSPPQTAEIHQAREEIFEDFPFSESLSEFITKIEDAEGSRPREIKQTEENMLGRRSRNSMNHPDADLSSQKSADLSLGCCQEPLQRRSPFDSEAVRRDNTGLVDRTSQSADLTLGRFQESLQRRSPFDSEAVRRGKTGLVDRTSQDADLSLGCCQESLERCSPFDSEAVGMDGTGLVGRTFQSVDLTLGCFRESLERRIPFDSEAVGRDNSGLVDRTSLSADLTLGCFQESLERRSPFDSEAVARDNTGLLNRTSQSAVIMLGRFEESLETHSPFDGLSTWGQGQKSPTKVLSNGTYDHLDLCSVIKGLNKSAVASEKMLDGEKKSSDDAGAKITSKLKGMGDHYNASADLFEASGDPEDYTLHLQHNGSPYGRLVSLTGSPCTDVLPYRCRNSHASVCSLSEDCKAWNNSLMEDFAPYLQSTPVLRRLSRTGGLSSDTWRCTGVSIRTKSRSTIRHLFLKGVRQRKSALFYRLSGDYSLWSPNLSPFSNSEGTTAPFPKTGRKMLSHKPWKMESVVENKENYDNQTGHNNLMCTVKETGTGKEEPIRRSADTLGNPKYLSPVNRLLQESEDGLCSAEETLLPSDWSPELFSGKSDISQSSDCLQRRLFQL